MTYKGYRARVTFDDEAELLHGEVLGLRDVVTFRGSSIDELRDAFEASVDGYLAWCEERGRAPDRPFSGRLLLRMDPDVHRDATVAADRAGASLNAYIVRALEERLERDRGDGVRAAITTDPVASIRR
jgi:predicted HicB family RNase H-like nuclease